MATEKWVLVGRKTLAAPILKANGDPIRKGEVVEVTGRGLDYVKSKTYQDTLGNFHNVFEPYGSPAAKRAIAEATGRPVDDEDEPKPQTRSRRRTRAA